MSGEGREVSRRVKMSRADAERDEEKDKQEKEEEEEKLERCEKLWSDWKRDDERTVTAAGLETSADTPSAK